MGAVATGMDKLIFAIVCRFGNMFANMSFETKSSSCDFILSLGCFAICQSRYVIHSVWISEEVSAFLTVGLPSNVWQGLFVP